MLGFLIQNRWRNFLMSDSKNEKDLLERVAKKYKEEGYNIIFEPRVYDMPFNLGSYRPDLIAFKPGFDSYLIEVKKGISNISVDQFREIASSTDQNPGWHFLLVTGDDVPVNELEIQNPGPFLSTEQVILEINKGEKILSFGEKEAAFFIFWRSLEAILRRRAEDLDIPIEHFPTLPLIKHLYSQGELSIKHFDELNKLISTRNQITHGLQVNDLDIAVNDLRALLKDLLAEWLPEKK